MVVLVLLLLVIPVLLLPVLLSMLLESVDKMRDKGRLEKKNE
jgi:hypothetical protein